MGERDEEGELSGVGDTGEDAEREKGGRGEKEADVGEVLVRIGANRGLNGAQEDDVETGESEDKGVEEGGMSVVLRLVRFLGRGE